VDDATILTVGITNWPVLTSNVTLQGLYFQNYNGISGVPDTNDGKIDTKGFVITADYLFLPAVKIYSTTLNSAIQFVVNQATIKGCTFYGNTIITTKFSLQETYFDWWYGGSFGKVGSIFMGNTKFIFQGNGRGNIGEGGRSVYNGDLEVEHVAMAGSAARTDVILGDGGSVHGNFKYSNKFGGGVIIGDEVGSPTKIDKKIDINVQGVGSTNDYFQAYNIDNTEPGQIQLQNAGSLRFYSNSIEKISVNILDQIGAVTFQYNTLLWNCNNKEDIGLSRNLLFV
jgi:hypothetical protein